MFLLFPVVIIMVFVNGVIEHGLFILVILALVAPDPRKVSFISLSKGSQRWFAWRMLIENHT